MHAPPGTLATLTGLSGGAHYGFGKGVGGLVGGVLKETFGSTAVAFRYSAQLSLSGNHHSCRLPVIITDVAFRFSAQP